MSDKDKDTPSINAVNDFFQRVLMEREPKGKFCFTKKIKKDTLKPGETMVFTYKARAVYYAKALEGRQDNESPGDQKHYFVIDMDSLVPCDVHVKELNLRMESNGVVFRIAGPGWQRFFEDGRSVEDEYEFFRRILEEAR